MDVGKVTASITRPNDITAYTAGDVVSDTPGTRFTFSLVGRYVGTNEGGTIQSAVCTSSVSAATPPDLEFWLFDTDVAAVADNGAFAPTDAEILNLIAIITFATAGFKKGTVNMACVQNNLNIAFRADRLFGVLVVRNAYTPTANEVFQVMLQAQR